MADNSLLIQIVIGVTSVIGTYLTVKYKPSLINKITNAPEPDRSHFLFDGYEKLIKELQSDLDKTRLANERQSISIDHMQEKINALTSQLSYAQGENKRLAKRLSAYENGQ